MSLSKVARQSCLLLEKSWIRDPKVFVDTGVPIPGEAPLLKTRIHLRRDAAEQPWKELRRVGWQLVDPFGEHLLILRAGGGCGCQSKARHLASQMQRHQWKQLNF